MAEKLTLDLQPIAEALSLRFAQVENAVQLLDDGNTVPFITRYRKDQTGGLDEEQIRRIESRLIKMRLLEERKLTILRSIEGQGKLTDELRAAIGGATDTRRLEDLYLPHKPKKQTLATAARERGLEPLADEILTGSAACADLDARAADFVNPDRQVKTAADALLGAGHILAERFSERADLRGRLREIMRRTGKLTSAAAQVAAAESPADPPPAAPANHSEAPEGSPQETNKTETKPSGSKGKSKRDARSSKDGAAFRDYYEFAERLAKVPPHRVLAINRGERQKMLKVKVTADMPAMEQAVDETLVPAEHPHAAFLRGCARDTLARLIYPSLEREVRRELTDAAELHAVEVFARNLRSLLLQPPIAKRRVLAVDPGFRSGCKLAALDEFGNLLEHAVVHLVGKAERRQEAKDKIVELVRQHQLTVVAIGNGTACRETEVVIAELIAEPPAEGVAYVIVNEAGASVYSTSRIGREEFPNYDATLRGAISIGRRLQDPLSELVKIDPANIGVGMYQHDVKAKHLRDSLDAVVQSCVNFVGVDLNVASPSLLRYVSGLNQLTARRVYEYRSQKGPFKNREQLKEVPGIGDAAFIQSAGFLKIAGGDNPLDTTWIHPESYAAAEHVLSRLELSTADLADRQRTGAISEQAQQLDVAALSAELQVGAHLLRDILAQIIRPGRDPREALPQPVFKRGILKIDDVTPGMELAGTVLNVVDFGAFVDIGLKDPGLVHVSQLADRFVEDPHQVVAVGDIVRVWVKDADKERRRISLTMIAPGTERSRTARQPKVRGGASDGSDDGQRRNNRRGGRKRADGKAATGRSARAAHKKPAHAKPPRPKPKPRPVVPLTDEMKKGKEPLRTFGDLKQFIELKSDQPPEEQPH